jgi:hypothetical protein
LHFLSLLAGNTTALFRHFLKISTLLLLFFTAKPSAAQWYKIKGTVYDSSRTYPVELVTVLSTSGRGTVTNSDGYYEIEVTEKDSVWFSYLNKPTIKFPVAKIINPLSFDISLKVNVPVLKEVKVRPKNYRFDSLQNRQDYAKVFNYQKPKLTPSISNMGVGFDLDAIINMFRFRRNKSMQAFQKRLFLEEQEKFVDHRFNKALVRRLTPLTGNELDSFMIIYRPPYEFALLTSDYEFGEYIKESYRRFLNGLSPIPFLKSREDE